MKMTRIASIGILCFLTTAVWAQTPGHAGDRFTREANIKYAKRIDRVIDNRQKQNKVLEYPGADGYPLQKLIWDVLWKSINDIPKIDSVYEDAGLSKTYDKTELQDKLNSSMVIQVPDRVLGGTKDSTIIIPFEPEKITKYRIQEDWLFDANYSDFRPHIIAIAPLYSIFTETGLDLGEQPAYWLKFEDLIPVLAQVKVFNTQNSAARLTYDQFFQMRHFASYIVKEQNVFDADIKHMDEFKDDGIAALLESDRIKNDLFILEHDLWEY